MLPSMQVMNSGMNDDDSVTIKMKSHDELEVKVNDDEHSMMVNIVMTMREP